MYAFVFDQEEHVHDPVQPERCLQDGLQQIGALALIALLGNNPNLSFLGSPAPNQMTAEEVSVCVRAWVTNSSRSIAKGLLHFCGLDVMEWRYIQFQIYGIYVCEQ